MQWPADEADENLYVAYNPYVGYNNSPQRLIQPDYKPWGNLSPYTKIPATAIDLETLIPGHPRPLNHSPCRITFLYVDFSKKDVSFAASVPPDSNGQKHYLKAGYQWGNIQDHKFEYR